MTFYKLLDVDLDIDIYVNPRNIDYYTFNQHSVEILLSSHELVNVDKSDFTNMMIMEGASEY